MDVSSVLYCAEEIAPSPSLKHFTSGNSKGKEQEVAGAMAGLNLYCGESIAPPPPLNFLNKTAKAEESGTNSKSDEQGEESDENGDLSNLYCAPEITLPPPVVIPPLAKVTKVAPALTEEQTKSIPKKHAIICKCGCIPAIPSLSSKWPN